MSEIRQKVKFAPEKVKSLVILHFNSDDELTLTETLKLKEEIDFTRDTVKRFIHQGSLDKGPIAIVTPHKFGGFLFRGRA